MGVHNLNPSWLFPGSLLLLAFTSAPIAKEAVWQPVIQQYCLDCHDADSEKGDLNLEKVLTQPLAQNRDSWERVARQLQA